jgi:outer membrane protein TolC
MLSVLVPTTADTPAPPLGSGGMTLLDAVRSTLANHVQIQVQRLQSDVARGLRLVQTGAFDTVISGGVSRGRTYQPLTALERLEYAQVGVAGSPLSQLLSATSANIEVTRLFRNGVSVSAIGEVDRSVDNLLDANGLSTSNLAFVVNLPLLQGRGREVTDSGEAAARMEEDATLLDLNQTIAQQLARTASDYWNAVAAIRNYEVTSASEARGRALLESTKALIEADLTPRNDINSVNANLSDRMARRIAAQQNAVAAREQLALDMGLSSSEITQLKNPIEDFPSPEGQPLPLDDDHTIDRLLAASMLRRADLLAARRRHEEAEVRARASRNGLLPRLDLSVSTGYSGLVEGRSAGDYLSAPLRGVNGANLIGGLQFYFPPANNTARGNLLQADALVRQNDARVDQASRTVASDVLTAVSDVRKSIVRLHNAKESVDSFERALEGERQKFSLGLNSVIDVLTVEDRLTAALSNRVDAQLSYAVSLVEYRLATGTIVAPRQGALTINRDLFVTLPPEPAGIHGP